MRTDHLDDIFNFYAILATEELVDFTGDEDRQIAACHEAIELSYVGNNLSEIVCRNTAYKIILEEIKSGNSVDIDIFNSEQNRRKILDYISTKSQTYLKSKNWDEESKSKLGFFLNQIEELRR